MRRVLARVALLTLLPAVASAQRLTPAQSMRAFLEAFAAERFVEGAAFIDSASFDAWRRQRVDAARRRGASRVVTAAELMRLDPDMPRAVADYQAKRANVVARRYGVSEMLLRDFPGLRSVDEIARVDVREAAASWLRARHPKWIAERALRVERERCPPDSALVAEVRALARVDSQSVIGTVLRDSLAFVVIQQVLASPGEFGRDESDAALAPRAVRMRREGDRWVLLDWDGWFHDSAMGAIVSQAPACPPPRTSARRRP